MSIIVMPLGVIAAIYLHEYAKNNAFTRIIRIAVINLAGVPSIVYGVFGLGFLSTPLAALSTNCSTLNVCQRQRLVHQGCFGRRSLWLY